MKNIIQGLQRIRAVNRSLFFTALMLSVLLMSATGKAQPAPISVCTLSQNRAAYNLKPLYLSGVVTSIQRHTPSSGRQYTIVQVKDSQGQCFVRLYFRHPQNFLKRGQATVVFGRYFQKFRYFRWTYEHEIQPTEFEVGGCSWFLTQNGWAKKPGC